LKPEGGHLIENFAFTGNGVAHYDIKGGNPIRGHKQKMIPHGIQVTHFATVEKFQFWKIGY